MAKAIKITIEELNAIRAEAELKPVSNISQRMINILYKEAADMVSVTGVRVVCKGGPLSSKSADYTNNTSSIR